MITVEKVLTCNHISYHLVKLLVFEKCFHEFFALFCKRLCTFRAPADIPVSIYAFCSPIFQVCNNMHIFELESILMHLFYNINISNFSLWNIAMQILLNKKSYHAMRSSINYILKYIGIQNV